MPCLKWPKTFHHVASSRTRSTRARACSFFSSLPPLETPQWPASRWACLSRARAAGPRVAEQPHGEQGQQFRRVEQRGEPMADIGGQEGPGVAEGIVNGTHGSRL